MAESRGKSIGLIILVIILIMFFVKVTPALFGPFGAISGVWEGIRHSVTNGLNIGNGFFPRLSHIPFLSIIFFILWIMVIAWVYRDAERRGMNGLLWALLVFIGNLIGLIIYLIIRTESPAKPAKPIPDQNGPPRHESGETSSKPPSTRTKSDPASSKSATTCSKCKEEIDPGFAFCPHCGKDLQNTCPGCQSQVEKGWKVCPHCGTELKN